MKNFYSFEEFVKLPDNSYENPPREDTRCLEGLQWLEYYLIAKNSFIRFGEDGPPFGSLVEKLGFGKLGCYKLPLVGIDEKDVRFFLLSGEVKNYYNGRSETVTYMIDRKLWFKEIKLFEDFTTIFNRAMETISREEFLKEFSYYLFKDKDVDELLAGRFLHPKRQDRVVRWFRFKGVIC